jgi:hypothetical protein
MSENSNSTSTKPSEEHDNIISILNDFLDPEEAVELTARLEQEIGQTTEDASLKKSLTYFKSLYDTKEEPRQLFKKFLLYSVIVFHMAVVLGNFTIFFTVPFIEPIWIWLPICTFIFWVSFINEVQCPITRIENRLRTNLGMRRIGGFVGHYIIRPIRRRFFSKKP